MCVCVCVCVCVSVRVCVCVCVWCVYDHGGCGVWVCGYVGVVCRELMFGINPNRRVFPRILDSCTDKTDRIHNDWIRAGRRVLLEL